MGTDLEVGDITQVFQKPTGLLQFLFETTVFGDSPEDKDIFNGKSLSFPYRKLIPFRKKWARFSFSNSVLTHSATLLAEPRFFSGYGGFPSTM